jgi:hypothetical protein
MEIGFTCSSDHMPGTNQHRQMHPKGYEYECNQMVFSMSIRGECRRPQRRSLGASRRQVEERYRRRERLLYPLDLGIQFSRKK